MKIVDTGSGVVGVAGDSHGVGAVTGTGFTFTTLATAPANESFRGVAFTPESAPLSAASRRPQVRSLPMERQRWLPRTLLKLTAMPYRHFRFRFIVKQPPERRIQQRISSFPARRHKAGTPGHFPESGQRDWRPATTPITRFATDAHRQHQRPSPRLPTTILTINNAAAPTIASFTATPLQRITWV